MKARIKEIRKTTGLSQAAFGEAVGVSFSAEQKWELGISVPSDAAIMNICRKFNVNEAWLRTGEGEMKAPISREQEMAELVGSLMEDSPESLRSALVTTLLRFDPGGPEWALLERIFNDVSSAMQTEK